MYKNLKDDETTIDINKDWFSGKSDLVFETSDLAVITDKHIAMAILLGHGYKIKPMFCYYVFIDRPEVGGKILELLGDNYFSRGQMRVLFRQKKGK